MIEEESVELIYPSHADDANLSKTTPTPFEGLVATLATVGFTSETRLVQSLHRLEIAQITLATAKMLNNEEEKIIDIDEHGVLKVKPSDAKLAQCLTTLEENIKSLTSFIGALPEGDLDSTESLPLSIANFSKYKFLKMITALGEALVTERNKARATYNCVDVSVYMCSCMGRGESIKRRSIVGKSPWPPFAANTPESCRRAGSSGASSAVLRTSSRAKSSAKLWCRFLARSTCRFTAGLRT
jgi:hypothetical protein